MEVAGAFRAKLAYIADYVLMDAIPPEGLNKTALKDNLRETWICFLDYLMALDSINASFSPFFASKEKNIESEAFNTSYWIFLAEFRFGKELIKALEGTPGAPAILNEPIPELGLPWGSFSEFKSMVEGENRTREMVLRDRIYFSLGTQDAVSKRASQIRDDKNAILKMTPAARQNLPAMEAPEKISNTPFKPWFPFAGKISPWNGKTTLWRPGRSFISTSQVEFLLKKLEPGDILFSRQDWHFPSVGLPGYWSHAALYIGDEASRKTFFDTPEVADFVKSRGKKSDFENLLKEEYKEKYPPCLVPDGKGHPPRVIEAVPEGVLFSSVEHFAQADSLCVLRPLVTKGNKAMALFQAFRYLGKPYDFNFDYESDSAIAGSEVLYRSYQPESKYKGMKFPLQEMLGNYFSSPNAMVGQFDQQFETPDQQSDLVVFIDGDEKTNRAEFTGMGEFRHSWKRPKWNVPFNKP